MCGVICIAGTRPVNRHEFASLVRTLTHRGPDDQGEAYFNQDAVALGHTRLAILDLSSAGHQPMYDRDRQVCVTYNGEIFNFPELRAWMRKRGVVFATETDTELLIHLYLMEGMKFLSRLRGMYAFLVHDTRSGSTFFARDPFGIKPLYMRRIPGGYAFASEPSVLRRLGANSLDVKAAVRALCFLYPAGASFGIQEITRIEPGQVGVVNREGGLAFLKEGTILPDGRGPGRAASPPSIEELISELRRSVEEHLLSDVPVGVMFSGGMDSTLIAALARNGATAEKLKLFSLAATDAASRDRLDKPENISETATSLGLPISFVTSPEDAIDVLDATIQHIGEPVADPSSIATSMIAREAKRQGYKVLLSGHGADELFAGYRRHLAAHYFGHKCIPRALFVVMGMLPSGTDASRVGRSLLEPVYWRAPMLHSVLDIRTVRKMLHPDVLKELGGEADIGMKRTLLAPYADSLRGLESATLLRQTLRIDQRFYMSDQNLNYLDKVAMMHGVEGRFPFLSTRIASLAARFQDKDMFSGFNGKNPLSLVLQRLGVSVSTSTVGKRGFGLPLSVLFSNQSERLHDRLKDFSRLANSQFWSPAFVRRVRGGSLVEVSQRTLFGALTLDSWLRDWGF